MTASNSKVMGGEKNLNKTTAETRRASKPLMEKRRRARINQSLAVLKSLIVDSQRVEGQKHSKLEKADILEMTVSHLQSVKKSDEQKFMEGFEECLSESLKFLEKAKINPSVVDKLADHLKHFQDNVDHGSLLKDNPSSASSTTSNPGSSVDDGSSRLLTLSMSAGEQGESDYKFPLNVPQFQMDSSKPTGSSQSHTSCLSPSLSISNDSNNNNFMNEPDGGFQSVSPAPSLGHGSQRPFELMPTDQSSPESSAKSDFSKNISTMDSKVKEEPFVLNLSTNSSSSYFHDPNPMSTISYPAAEPMEDSCEPLDFSKPLNLSKYPVGYRLSEDGVWRPW